MNEKYSKTLELDKILSMLAELTCCDDARDAAKMCIRDSKSMTQRITRKTAAVMETEPFFGTI